jgi:hypothetical protein
MAAMPQFFRRRWTLLAALALASGLVGCSAFQEKIAPKLNSEIAPAGGPVVEPAAKYIVEIRPHKGKPQMVEKDLTEPMHVQTALEKTKALDKYRRMDLELYRPLPSGGWHKMKLEFDRANRQVPPEYDYSLLPGDRVIVTEDPRTIVDDALETALRPLGIDPPTRRPKLTDKYEIRG